LPRIPFCTRSKKPVVCVYAEAATRTARTGAISIPFFNDRISMDYGDGFERICEVILDEWWDDPKPKSAQAIPCRRY
jgi:hypothetical protein